MPFTPFHMGPGILFKALLQGSFSLMVFGWAQIIMDIQPLIVLITGKGHLHGFTHTYIGVVKKKRQMPTTQCLENKSLRSISRNIVFSEYGMSWVYWY